MLRHTGRAALKVGWALHHVCHFLLTIAILVSLAAVGATWRLSRGPVDLGFLKNQLENAMNTGLGQTHVTFGGASIAWGGFSRGLDQPLVLRVTDLTVDQAGSTSGVHVPVAEATLSARWLLIGRILPRSITLESAHLVFTRNADGSPGFDLGDTAETTPRSPLTSLLSILGRPTETDRQPGGRRLSQLSAISIHGASLRIEDRLLGMTWSADRANIDFSRHPRGGIDGRVAFAVSLGGQKAVVAGTFNMAPAARSVHVIASLSQVTPKALAGTAPILASLAALDVPLTLDGEADFGPNLIPTHFRATGRAGTGKVHTDTGSIPIRRAEFVVSGSLEQATLETGLVELQPAPGAVISTLVASGPLSHLAGRLGAVLHLTLDHADFADLPALWPADIAPNPREWVTQNIKVGIARDGKADLVLDTPDTALDVTLSKATATLEGDDVSVTWLPTVPRVEHGKAHLELTDADRLEIDIRSAQQTVNGADPIAVPFGHVTITGLTKKDQIATVQCETIGSVPGAIALLREPRLRILDRHPIDLRAPAGNARISIHAIVPLLRDLRIDDVVIHGTGNLSKVHLSGVVAGRDLDEGTLLLDVDTNHLSIKGAARLGAIQSNIDAMMDFRAGPPSQVLRRIQVTGRATARALTDSGLEIGDMLAGDVGLNVILNERRSGDGEVIADADLSQAELIVAPLAWRKPVGGAAKASARVILSKDRLMSIDRMTVDGAGIQVQGSVTAADGRLDIVKLDRAVLGRTEIRGTVRMPREAPILIDLNGPVLDMSAKLLEKSPKRDPTAPRPPPGRSWSLQSRFDRVLLAHDQVADQVTATGESDGTITRNFAVSGRTGPGNPFSLRIGQGKGEKGPAARVLAMDVEDVGSFLRGLDITQEIKGGTMTIAGAFDDTNVDHTLSGTLNLDDFRVIHAPALGKLLQAVTLYGLVEALSGPGLSFSRLTAPFQLDDGALVITDARAFSASLGLTAHGRIDRNTDRLDLDGTLVPAYLFNSILGRIPLIGGLFSAEKGGGLIAMSYALHGPMDNPSVTVNPLSALTPGFLRNLFGPFDQPAAAPPPAPAAQVPLDRAPADGNAPNR